MIDSNDFEQVLANALKLRISDNSINITFSERVQETIRRRQRNNVIGLAFVGATGSAIAGSQLLRLPEYLSSLTLHVDISPLPVLSLSPELLTASVGAAMLAVFAVIIRRSFESF
jgi:hypothetical protein